MKKAFTVVELLVVISIICILIGLLWPAIEQARYQAEINDQEYAELAQLANKNDSYKQRIKIAMEDQRISRKEYDEIKAKTALTAKEKLTKEVQ